MGRLMRSLGLSWQRPQPRHAEAERIAVWFQDEARVGRPGSGRRAAGCAAGSSAACGRGWSRIGATDQPRSLARSARRGTPGRNTGAEYRGGAGAAPRLGRGDDPAAPGRRLTAAAWQTRGDAHRQRRLAHREGAAGAAEHHPRPPAALLAQAQRHRDATPSRRCGATCATAPCRAGCSPARPPSSMLAATPGTASSPRRDASAPSPTSIRQNRSIDGAVDMRCFLRPRSGQARGRRAPDASAALT